MDGVYSGRPRLDPTATRYDEISFMEVVAKDLRVMDLTAITFCMDNGLPIRVFDLMAAGQHPQGAQRRLDRHAGPMKSQAATRLGGSDPLTTLVR